MRKCAWLLLIVTVLTTVAEWRGYTLPTVSWAYTLAYDIDFLHFETESGKPVAWFGYLVAVLSVVGSFVLLMRRSREWKNPSTERKIKRFLSVRRGAISLAVLAFLVFIAGLDQLIVGKRALYLEYDGKVYFPAFERRVITAEELGIGGDDAKAELNYRILRKRIEESGKGSIIMPMIPFDPTLDTVAPLFIPLETKGEILVGQDGEPMQGRVSTLYKGETAKRHMIFECRLGQKHGKVIGKLENGETVYEANYREGKIDSESVRYTGEGEVERFLSSGDGVLGKVLFHAAPPNWKAGHYLGTTPQGNDLLAYLYGGLQINILAAMFYIPIIYAIGISVGLIMGYFGGVFDIVVQRIIEVFSTIPFLFVVIIIGSVIPAENRGLGMILSILILFGWMGMTYLMRTAAFKEKARDYVAAARVSGASTPRVIFTHILPNTVAILVTLVPFSVSSVILALSSLDYLGFGLPPQYATWGNLLNIGLSNVSKPWLAFSAFTMLIGVLILVTFVGEAVREAFDAKKFTRYK